MTTFERDGAQMSGVTEVGILECVPVEIVVEILSMLGTGDLITMACTCRRMRELCFHRSMWMRWVLVKPTTDVAPAASSSAAVATVGKQIWVHGGGQYVGTGLTDVFSTISRFEFASRSWSVVNSCKGANEIPTRTEHTLTENEGTLFLFGGTGGWLGYHNKLYAFPPLESPREPEDHVQQVTTTHPPAPRSAHTAVCHNGKLYIFGGWDNPRTFEDLWCFDFSTSVWTELHPEGDLPGRRRTHSAVVCNDCMYVFGGFCKCADCTGSYDSLHELNLQTLVWRRLEVTGDVPSPRGRCGMAVNQRTGHLYLLGGWNRVDYFSDLYEFNIATRTWRLLPIEPPPETAGGLCQHSLVVMNLGPNTTVLVLYGGFLAATKTFSNSIYALRLQ
ncbi:Kelch-type beta propeller [Pelomyxa schiedti]|nr:Kelch-type beta propeller [Pelomyxa schiedti]